MKVLRLFAIWLSTVSVASTLCTAQSKVVPTADRVAFATPFGAGRYLGLHYEALPAIGVFDIEKAEVTHHLAPPSLGAKFAGGAQEVVFVESKLSKVTITKIRIDSWRNVAQQDIPLSKAVGTIALGAAGRGPLLLMSERMWTFVDLDSLKPLSPTLDASRDFVDAKPGRNAEVFAAPHGKAFAVRTYNGMLYLEYNTKGDAHTLTGAHFRQGGQWCYPNSDGTLFLSGYSILNNQGARIRSSDSSALRNVMSVDSDWTAVIKREVAGISNIGYELHLSPPEAAESVAVVKGIKGMPHEKSKYFHQNVFVAPRLGRCVNITPNALEVFDFDWKQLAADGGKNFLAVDAPLYSMCTSGKPFTLKLGVDSNEPASLTLQSGPEGLQLDNETLHWNVPTDLSGQHSVVVTATAGALKTRCCLLIDAAPTAAATAPNSAVSTTLTPSATATGPPKSAIRKWVDKTGKFSIEAAIEKVIGRENVVLRSKDGKVIQVPLAYLSPKDILEAVKFDISQGTTPEKADP